VVLSHGHWYHTDGLKFFAPEGGRRKLVAHPDIFADRHRATGEYNGTACTRRGLETKFDLVLTREPYQISEAVYFLGEIPRANDFEAQKTSFFRMEDGERLPHFLMDDSALAIRTRRGLVIITGCSHSGVCNIVEHAKKVCEESRVHAVLGGFHLLNNSERPERTVGYFQENPVSHLYPMHCTDLPSLCRFHAAFGSTKLCSGDFVEIAVS
jgi:7,8-dihydropterin-6-yl-methyl-4-(beta-D-ribofuranosyl)aminobenzene 5'-phosphate synthase